MSYALALTEGWPQDLTLLTNGLTYSTAAAHARAIAAHFSDYGCQPLAADHRSLRITMSSTYTLEHSIYAMNRHGASPLAVRILRTQNI